MHYLICRRKLLIDRKMQAFRLFTTPTKLVGFDKELNADHTLKRQNKIKESWHFESIAAHFYYMGLLL
jgi:hypothetical protein